MRYYYLIETKYHGPTNHRGARVSAKRADGYGRKVTIPYDHSMNPSDNGEQAALVLLGDYDTRHRIIGVSSLVDGWAFIVDTNVA